MRKTTNTTPELLDYYAVNAPSEIPKWFDKLYAVQTEATNTTAKARDFLTAVQLEAVKPYFSQSIWEDTLVPCAPKHIKALWTRAEKMKADSALQRYRDEEKRYRAWRIHYAKTMIEERNSH